MVVLIGIGILLAVIIAAFIIELMFVALYPGVSVPRQYLEEITGRPRRNEAATSAKREEVTFQVRGTTVNGWLFMPQGQSSPVPCIVMAHGLGGVKNMGLEIYAARFQQAGIAVLAFDYRYMGDSEGAPRQLIWIPHQLEDYAAAVSYARSINEIDPSMIALWGTSLSGGHVIVTAARDNRIACVSAQCPLLDGLAAAEEQRDHIGLKHVFRMAGHAQRDLVRSWLGLSPHKIPIVGKPGTVALMADVNAWKTFEELAPDDYINESCARIAIRMDKYRPINQMDKIHCPVLLQICDRDITNPLAVVKRAEEKLGQMIRVVHYPIDHFDIYLGDNLDKAIEDQLAFFEQHLLKKPGGTSISRSSGQV
ncbi:MAG: alpha/beta hydrolase [Dehalococcoidia bacterium]|nr:alpha/beta hydrolase [Dehalococcoidia bacterium]